MSDAKDYLTNTNLSIEKIAEYVGYNTVDHFSRTFKKHYYNSPQQFRKSL
jgi:AraC-like DNA-binding protein